MRIIIQRVRNASVTIGEQLYSSIGQGMMILVGIEDADNEEDIAFLVKKVVAMRIFDDENGVMNRSVMDIGGEVLVVSQFTLHASTKKGNRPSYIKAAKPDISCRSTKGSAMRSLPLSASRWKRVFLAPTCSARSSMMGL